MSTQGRIQQAARFVFEERQTRKPFEPIPDTFAPRTIDEAYAAQDELHKLLADTYGPLARYKIALTTRAMQQIVGLNDPVAAGILKKTIHHSPATIPSAEFVHLGIECEIALRLGADLSPGERMMIALAPPPFALALPLALWTPEPVRCLLAVA